MQAEQGSTVPDGPGEVKQLSHAVAGRFGQQTDEVLVQTSPVAPDRVDGVRRALGLLGFPPGDEVLPPHPSLAEVVSAEFHVDADDGHELRLTLLRPQGTPLVHWVEALHGHDGPHNRVLAVGARLADAIALLNLHLLPAGSMAPECIVVGGDDSAMPVIVDLASVLRSCPTASNDVRALAALIIWMLTDGAHPVDAPESALPHLPMTVPQEVEELLSDAIAAESRPDTCAEFASALRNVCRSLPSPWRDSSLDTGEHVAWPQSDGFTQWERVAEWQSLPPGPERDQLAFGILLRAGAGMLSLASAVWRGWPELRQRVGDPADLVHDFIASSVERDLLSSVRRVPGGSLRKWLATCLRNHIRGFARRRSRDGRLWSLDDDDVRRAATIDRALATTEMDPGRRLDVIFDLDVLLEGLGAFAPTLSDDDWRLFRGVLCRGEDYLQVIGALTRPLTVTNAQWRVHRMRKSLASSLMQLLRDWEESLDDCIAEGNRIIGLLPLIAGAVDELRDPDPVSDA